jgi:Cys-tRNA(Pro)/Cys-tRNA(Cys) deacylase
MKKKYPTYIDETAQLVDEIYVSAGMRGIQVKLKQADLKNLTAAVLSNLL